MVEPVTRPIIASLNKPDSRLYLQGCVQKKASANNVQIREYTDKVLAKSMCACWCCQKRHIHGEWGLHPWRQKFQITRRSCFTEIQPPGGKYGNFGGRFVPESMVSYLEELTSVFECAIQDPSFWEEYISAKPTETATPLHQARNPTAFAGGATVWLKREDQNGCGSHKTRSIVGQLLLARRMGRHDIVADCAAAKHGKFAAAMCARLDLRCLIIIGEDDHDAQLSDISEIKLLGATVTKVRSATGLGTWRAATAKALRYVVSNYESSYWLTSSPAGPHPLPAIMGTFQSLLGAEVQTQMNAIVSHGPDAIVTCIGSGSAAVGLFKPFLSNPAIRLVGVEADRAAVLTGREIGVLQGSKTYCLQDHHGQIIDSHSVSPDLNTSCVGPELALWRSQNLFEVSTVTDTEAEKGFDCFYSLEEIRIGKDTGYAITKVIELAKDLGRGKNIVLLVTGPDRIAGRYRF